MKQTLVAGLLAISFALPSGAFAQTAARSTPKSRATAATKSNAIQKSAEAITAAQLKDYLYFVASDEMEGRDTPSRGLDLTAKFLATMMARFGAKPAGDNGTYYQKFTLTRRTPDATKAQAEFAGQKLVYGTDFIADDESGTIANAPLVFGGNGWMFKSKNIDALQSLDVRGKVVVIYSDGVPAGVTQTDFAGKQGVDWADPQTNARLKGAAGVVAIATERIQGRFDGFRRNLERGSLTPDKLKETAAQPEGIPMIFVSRPTAEKMLQGESSDLAKVTAGSSSNAVSAGFNFAANKTVNFTTAGKIETLTTQNVVAMMEGSDPTLKAEMVAVGAHYDHVGVNENAPGADKIWNGADDDGSGTVAVLAMAEALSKAPQRPKRSILFVWHAGEEKGLWGSEYFTKFPPAAVPIDKVVTQLNIDMIGRSKAVGDTNAKNAELSGADEIYVIGSKMMSTELGDLSERVNNGYLKLGFNYRYDAPNDPNRFFFRSDHFNYAQKGIPVIFYFDGVHEDYHQPGDHPDKIDYPKMERVTRTIYATMMEIANLAARPKVDKQLPAELTQR